MSYGRCGYTDDDDNGSFAMWRGQVASAIRGKRGQAFLRDLIAALDAMPEKELIAHELRKDGAVCALGCLGAARGVALEDIDPEDHETLSETFNIAHQLVQEVEWVNDESGGYWKTDTPAKRWQRVRDWAAQNLKG